MEFILKPPDLTDYAAGNTGTEGVWQFDSGTPGPNVVITALVHGNELCGAWALIKLLENEVKPNRGKLTLIFCNLEAFRNFNAKYHDQSRFVDEDMNRVWSDAKLAQTVTQELRRARDLQPYIAQADWLLDLHSMHEVGAPLLLTGLLPRNLALAFKLGAPQHIVVDAGHQDGIRMRDYGHLGQADGTACALLLECGFHGDPASVGVAVDMAARFLLASGAVQPGGVLAQWLAPLPLQQTAVQVTHAIVAQSDKLTFSQGWQGLQCIARAGTELARDGSLVHVTPYDNCTLIMPSLRQLRAGVTVMRLAQPMVATPNAIINIANY